MLNNLRETNKKEFVKGIVYSTLRDLPNLSYSISNYKNLTKDLSTFSLNRSSLDYKNFKAKSTQQTVIVSTNSSNKKEFLYNM